MKVSLALTHFNRYDYIVEATEAVYDDPRISEIVISDDASTDGSYEKLQELFGDDPRVGLYRNVRNVGCYANKKRAVVRAGGGLPLEPDGSRPQTWVILFDSDNVMKPDYLDALEAEEPWGLRTAYLPTFAMPHFDYREFEGLTVDHTNVAELMENATFRTALNTGNCLFDRMEFLRAYGRGVEPWTSDSIFLNFCWLNAGNKLKFVPGLRYFHRIHEGSHYKQNHHRTGLFEPYVDQKLREMR